MILRPWDITVRAGAESSGIRFNVISTYWGICLSINLFLFSFCFSEMARLIKPLVYAKCSIWLPSHHLCCRYYYNPNIQSGILRLREVQSLEM